jgi:hypothetical protein
LKCLIEVGWPWWQTFITFGHDVSRNEVFQPNASLTATTVTDSSAQAAKPRRQYFRRRYGKGMKADGSSHKISIFFALRHAKPEFREQLDEFVTIAKNLALRNWRILAKLSDLRFGRYSRRFG